MKIAESASAVQRSVTKVALMSSLPAAVWVSPRSTSTAYTTANDVVERAVPAIRDARVLQSRRTYATSEVTANGPTNETIPSPSEGPSRRRIYAGSTSIPARNVSTIEPNWAMKTSQSCV